MSDKAANAESPGALPYESESTIDPEELAAILEQAEGAEEGCAQIVDEDGNFITLTAEQLAAAGIDVSNIGEADVATLLQLAHGATSSVVEETTGEEEEIQTVSIEDSNLDITNVATPKPSPTKKRSASEINLEDSGGESETKKFKSGPSVLHGSVDGSGFTELDEQTLASLVESGTVKFVDESGNEIPAAAVLAGAQG